MVSFNQISRLVQEYKLMGEEKAKKVQQFQWILEDYETRKNELAGLLDEEDVRYLQQFRQSDFEEGLKNNEHSQLMQTSLAGPEETHQEMENLRLEELHKKLADENSRQDEANKRLTDENLRSKQLEKCCFL